VHAGLEVVVVVSVSKLRNGDAAYAMRRGAYYTRNRVWGALLRVSPRRLHVAAHRLRLGPDRFGDRPLLAVQVPGSAHSA